MGPGCLFGQCISDRYSHCFAFAGTKVPHWDWNDTVLTRLPLSRISKFPSRIRDIFRAVHGDLFSAHFWEDIKAKVHNGQYPNSFPYPSRYRLKSRKFHGSILKELQRMSDTADAKQIHLVLDNLAVVDVELAGLSFLRLEVPYPSARVLVA